MAQRYLLTVVNTWRRVRKSHAEQRGIIALKTVEYFSKG